MQKSRRMQISNKIKISKSIRNCIIGALIVVIFVAFYGIIKSFNIDTDEIKVKKEIYEYSNKGDIDADINLKENQFIGENEVIDGQVYLSDLISNLDVHINYNYKGDAEEVIKYDYKIEAIVNASFAGTKEVYDILNKVETLKEVKDQESVSSSITIKDDISVDYEKYHQMVKDFKKAMSITADSNLIIRFTINTTTSLDNKDVDNKYVVNYKISLGDKVALIDKENKNNETNKVEDEVKVNNSSDIDFGKLIISIVAIVIALLVLKFIICKTEELRVIKNEFKVELNRILKSYEDKIVEIQDLHNVDLENATKVKDILQIRKLAEEALLPIYCYVKDEKEAYFIVTKYDKSYIYILK